MAPPSASSEYSPDFRDPRWKAADKLRNNLDAAMLAIERENPRLKNLLNQEYGREGMRSVHLGELIDLVSTIGFTHTEHGAVDVLGQIYEYFLGQFAQAEGKKGGQFYTPKSIVNLVVEMLEPFEGRVYDPAMGSGGFFVVSERFVEMHAGRQHVDKRKQRISIYGQESNPTTWRLAAMNLAIRGIGFDFGKEPADIRRVADTFHAWRCGEGYADEAGFCKVATFDEVARNDFVLTPGRYVGAATAAAGGHPFAERMQQLTGELRDQFAESDQLQRAIRENLRSLGYEI